MLELIGREFALDLRLGLDTIGLRLLGALVLCGLIGIERELHKNTAGLRTNMLIGLAAAVFALVTLGIGHQFEARDGFRMDPVRLVEAVASGVALLAAGVVVFARGAVRGLTTGAGMWLAAAIGLAVGLGQWWIAILATAAGLVVLALLRSLEQALGIKPD